MPTTIETHKRLREITGKIIGKYGMRLLDRMGTDVRYAHDEGVQDLMSGPEGFGYSDKANIIFYPMIVDENRAEQQLLHEMGHAYDFVVMKRNFDSSSRHASVGEIEGEVRAWIYAGCFHEAFGVKDWDVKYVFECLYTYINSYMGDINNSFETLEREANATTRRYLRRLDLI